MRKDLGALLLIGILTFLAYSNSFHGEFQYDDERLIRFNFALRDLSLWKDILRFEPFRPLTLYTYALNFQISQKDPSSYHGFNFVFHLLATGLFYIFIRRLSDNVRLCFFSAALFAVHPMNTEAVSYIASRPILLCAIFYLASILCFDAYLRKHHWAAVSGFCFFLLLGLLSKEEAALIPAVALLYNYFQFGAESVRKHGWFHIITLLLVFCAFVFRMVSMVENISPETIPVYFATEAAVWFRYLWLAIFPIPLNVDHDIPALHLTHWLFIVAIVAISAILLALYKIKAKHLWAAFFGTWFFLNLMPSSSVVPLNDFMAEHRAYLSMFGFCAGVAYLIQIKKSGSRMIAWSLALLLLFYSAATWKRNLVWQTKLSLWADAVEKSPMKFRPHLNLAFALFQRSAYKEAAEEYIQARSLNPTEPRIHTGLGFTFMEMGRPEPAETSFRIALKIDPTYIDARTGLGILRYRDGKYQEAISSLIQSYPFRRESSELIAMICDSYLALQQTQNAQRILDESSLRDSKFRHVRALVYEQNIVDARAELREIISQK